MINIRIWRTTREFRSTDSDFPSLVIGHANFHTLKHANVAPSSWNHLGLHAHEYFKHEMMFEFREFRLCEGA
jgi:hypothetical protein